MLFEAITVDYDLTPIVLIDKSGSTNSFFGEFDKSTNQFTQNAKSNNHDSDEESDDEDSDEEHVSNTKNQPNIKRLNVLETEVKKVIQDLSNIGATGAHLMLWDNCASLPNDENFSTFEQIETFKLHSSGGTSLTPALSKIPKSWLSQEKPVTDIHVYTDGEIGDSSNSLGTVLRKLFTNSSVRLFITTVEPNNKNYLIGDCQAGNAMYRAIQGCGLTGRVKKFVSYNRYHNTTPFTSLNNPDVPLGYAPFQQDIFKVTEIHKFVAYLEGHIASITDNNELLKLTHDLSLTISYLIRGKSNQIQRRTIDMFSDLFAETQIYKSVREMLLNEIDNHAHGKATTFQGYKRNREKVFEAAQLSLYENVVDSISLVENSKYASMIMRSQLGDTIIKTSKKNVTKSIVLSDKTYMKAGFEIGKYNVPMLPLNVPMDHDVYDQCVRQWIRANYAKRYNVNPASDLLLYYFLADALRVFVSDVSTELKKSYRDLTYLMLDRKRFGTTLTEMDYLTSNAPAPVVGSEDGIKYMLFRTMKYVGLTKNELATNDETGEQYEHQVGILQPFTFWYAFILAFGDETLRTAQLPFCQTDLEKDNLTPSTLLQHVSSLLQHVTELDCSGISSNYDYTCYLTLEDTSETGGYAIPPHKITKKISCCPNMVLSHEGFNSLCDYYNNGNNVTCPICCSAVDINEFTLVLSKTVLEEEELKANGNTIPVLDEPYYDISNYEVVNIDESEYLNDEDQTLLTLDSYNFNTVSYSINAPYVQEPLGTRSIEIKSQEEFNKYVQFKYPFLSKMNFDGLCLAGGFCRSVLLKQRLKDFDFFIHSQTGNHEEIFYRALSESMSAIKEMHPNTRFLIMYKHLFNVYEVVCVSDPNNFFTENYTLDNFKQYGFRSLHKFDKNTVIEPETGKIFRRKYGSKYSEVNEEAEDVQIENRDFSNYFEDGDVSGIKMHYRLQFILSRNKNIEDVFANFDFYQCRVAWDGKTTWFTEKSAKAYKYMINIINENNYSDLFDYRLSKYFTYGFSIVLPEMSLAKLKNKKILALGNNKFNISQINNKCIMVEHNSHIANQLASLESLEKKSANKDGKALYKSSLFCSLVSLLRYVKINDVSYIITKDLLMPDSNGYIKFQESEETVKFIDRIQTRIEGHDYYGQYRVTHVEKNDNNDDSDSEEEPEPVPGQISKNIFGFNNNTVSSSSSDSEEEESESEEEKSVVNVPIKCVAKK